jgi:hypothetical protein
MICRNQTFNTTKVKARISKKGYTNINVFKNNNHSITAESYSQ